MNRIFFKSIAFLGLVIGLAIGSYNVFNRDDNKYDPVTNKLLAAEKEGIVSPIYSIQKTTGNRTLDSPINYDCATQNDIFHMMLNSVDYFDSVSGQMIFPSDDRNVVNYINFQSRLSNSSSYSRFMQFRVEDNTEISFDSVTSSTCEYEKEVFCNNDTEISVFPNEKQYKKREGFVKHIENSAPIPDNERITIAEDGNNRYRYRTNPTNVVMSSMCIFPQEITIGFLRDFSLWEVTDIVEMNDSMYYHISGNTRPDYGKRLNVSRFEFWVDVNTGVLVKYQGFDSNNVLSDYMFTQNIAYEDNALSVTAFDEKKIRGYKETY